MNPDRIRRLLEIALKSDADLEREMIGAPNSTRKVELEIAHDKETGLTFLLFSYREGDALKTISEIGNRFVAGTSRPIQTFAWSDEIDLPRAEFRRAMIELSLERIS